jgi:hypothetical protein
VALREKQIDEGETASSRQAAKNAKTRQAFIFPSPHLLASTTGGRLNLAEGS